MKQTFSDDCRMPRKKGKTDNQILRLWMSIALRWIRSRLVPSKPKDSVTEAETRITKECYKPDGSISRTEIDLRYYRKIG